MGQAQVGARSQKLSRLNLTFPRLNTLDTNNAKGMTSTKFRIRVQGRIQTKKMEYY